MKLQDVLLKAMAKKITWGEAAEIIGVSDRTMRRWRERLVSDGYSGLVDRRRGKASDRRVPLEVVEEVLRLYQAVYFDLNIRHFHEKLLEVSKYRCPRVQLSIDTVAPYQNSNLPANACFEIA